MNDINDYGAPDGWQIISLGGISLSGCNGDAASTIKHEMLHALGFHHEHNRPDRATFLDVDLDATDFDNNFQLMDTSGWTQITEDDGSDRFPYETISVMHYCSFCGSSDPTVPVMTYKDGETFHSGEFMTTTDSLQAGWMYCNDRQDYVEKEHMSCSSTDKFGFQRPIFIDRVCDNQRDCYGGEDESQDGAVSLATCLPAGQTANNCCSSYLINGEEWGSAKF